MTTTLNATTSNGLVVTPDNSGTIQLQSNGTTELTISSAGAYGQLISGTAQASTSGTSIDFTGIPSWVKRITVMFANCSTNGASPPLVRLGTSSGIVSSGYLGASAYVGASTQGNFYTTGFGLNSASAGEVWHGTMTIALLNSSTNLWVASHATGWSSQAYAHVGGGSVTLPGVCDRVRITTVNGTDSYDLGSINILYEG